MIINGETYHSVTDVSKLLGVDYRRIRQDCKDGVISATRFGKRPRISDTELKRFVSGEKLLSPARPRGRPPLAVEEEVLEVTTVQTGLTVEKVTRAAQLLNRLDQLNLHPIRVITGDREHMMHGYLPMNADDANDVKEWLIDYTRDQLSGLGITV